MAWSHSRFVLMGALAFQLACSDEASQGSQANEGVGDGGTDGGEIDQSNTAADDDGGNDPGSAPDDPIDAPVDAPADVPGQDEEIADVISTDGAEDAGDTTLGDGSQDLAGDVSDLLGCPEVSAVLGPTVWPAADIIGDVDTLNVEVLDEWTQNEDLTEVTVRELRYTSWEVIDCAVHPVRIEAYYAIPTALEEGEDKVPGIVLAHGLGGCSNPDSAASNAAQLGGAILYYTAPGNCGSEGRGNADPAAIWDTVPDARGSWFWGHAVAGARAITVLTTIDEVDAGHLGMSGYSAGGVATLNVNGFDERLVATVPVSASGAWDLAVAAGGWQNDLLEAADLTADSPELAALLATLDPINQAPSQHGAVFLINGTQDEFFPINSTMATFLAMPGVDNRLMLIPNWDHGLFAADLGFCGTFDNSELALREGERAVAYWFGHYLQGSARFDEIAPIPTVEMMDLAGSLGVQATLDTDYEVVDVWAYLSNDSAYFFGGIQLENHEGNTWFDVDSLLPTSSFNPGNTVIFSEFRLRTDVGGLNDFWVTSAAYLPPDLVPDIRPVDLAECAR